MPEPDTGCELTEADCQRCIRIIAHSHPTNKGKLERLARAGFKLDQLETDNDANLASARGLLAEYFPGRAPVSL